MHVKAIIDVKFSTNSLCSCYRKASLYTQNFISYVECLSKGSSICILGRRFVVLGNSKPITIALGA